MRDASIAIIREIGVDTGGSNIQFAINPENGRMIVIEMNPRVSRSSALASKATGFPIAKIAAKLAVGLTLDEIKNDITVKHRHRLNRRWTTVVKFPRFAFEKFPEADPVLTTQMKSVGEAMSIGRTFKRRSRRVSALSKPASTGSWTTGSRSTSKTWRRSVEKLIVPNNDRIFYVRYALKAGMDIEEFHSLSNIDPWFLKNIEEIVDFEGELEPYKSDLPIFSRKDELPLTLSEEQSALATRTDNWAYSSASPKGRSANGG